MIGSDLSAMKMIVLRELPDSMKDVAYLIENAKTLKELEMARYILLDHNAVQDKLPEMGAKKINEEVNRSLKDDNVYLSFNPVSDLKIITREELVKWGCLKP